jgi:hypothetical protein
MRKQSRCPNYWRPWNEPTWTWRPRRLQTCTRRRNHAGIVKRTKRDMSTCSLPFLRVPRGSVGKILCSIRRSMRTDGATTWPWPMCATPVGVVNQQSIRHDQACSSSHGGNKNCEARTYSADQAKREMRAWFSGALNVTDTNAYYNNVINKRPYELPYCQYALFRWISATVTTALLGLYYDHAWHSVVKGLNRSGILAPATSTDVLHVTHDGSVELVESIDARFARNGNQSASLTRPWVGFAHSASMQQIRHIS